MSLLKGESVMSMPVRVPRGLFLVCLVALCFAASGCGGSKVSKNNFDKINVGMTLTEVESVLGKGEEQASASTGGSVEVPGVSGGGVSVPGQKIDVPKMSAQSYAWKEGTKIITITFLDGKVSAKAQAGL